MRVTQSTAAVRATKPPNHSRTGATTNPPAPRRTMHLDVIKDSPFRCPMLRAERVFAMLEHRPRPLRPRRSDDCHVRAYRWFLKHYLAAGDDGEERQPISMQMPHVEQAHRLYVAADVERRLILEARLLTTESSAEIAERFATDAKTIDYYEQLFFNVRDRKHASDWLITVIKGPPEDRVPSRGGVMTTAQRGFVYKLFARFGGPLVLDALIACLSPHGKPQCAEDAPEWFADAARDIVRSRAALAASLLVVDGQNVMRLLKLAQRTRPAGSAETAPNQLRPADYEKILEELERLIGTAAAKTASG